MLGTYDYTSGKLTLCFGLKRVDTFCPEPDKSVLIGVACKLCKEYKGIRNGYVLCGKCREDDAGAEAIRNSLSEEVRENAFRALDYM